MARKRGVTVEAVVTAAAEIADAEELQGVTLAAVAQRLDIRSPSLYAHVEGLDGLRRLLALRAASEMAQALTIAASGRTGIAALRELARAYRRFAGSRPGLYAAVQRAVRPGEDDELYDALASVIVPVLRALTEAGVRSDDLVHMTRAIRSALHGFVELDRSSGFGMPESVDESFDRLVDWLMAAIEGIARAGEDRHG